MPPTSPATEAVSQSSVLTIINPIQDY